MITFKYIQKVCIFTSLVLFFGTSTAYSSEKNQDEYAEFEISAKAIKLMKIESAPLKIKELNSFTISTSALISYGEKYGVYKFDGEHFKLIPLASVKKGKSVFKGNSKLLKNGDLIVVKGAPLLRVAHLQVSGQGGEGHGH